MTRALTKGDCVTFTCHILGRVKGKITSFTRDITNGQQHAIVELNAPHPPGSMCLEPVINLQRTQ